MPSFDIAEDALNIMTRGNSVGDLLDGLIYIFESLLGSWFWLVMGFAPIMATAIKFRDIGPVVIISLLVGTLYLPLLPGEAKLPAYVFLGMGVAGSFWKAFKQFIQR